MEITLWGVRGSVSIPGKKNVYYGANTSCVEARLSDGTPLIFDAGSGIAALGQTLPDTGVCHVFLTHGHLDHVQGLPFFPPLRQKGWHVHLYLPPWLRNLPGQIFNGIFASAGFDGLGATITTHELQEGKTIPFPGGAGVTPLRANHPGGGLCLRFFEGGVTCLYSGDHEIGEGNTEDMLRGVSMAIVDASFAGNDYRPGWGHSTWQDWVTRAKRAGVETLILSHHAPYRTDEELDALQQLLTDAHAGAFKAYVGKEGMRWSSRCGLLTDLWPSTWTRDVLEELSRYKEESVLLDRILYKAREVSGAEAGTIYLIEGNELVFAYAQNDALADPSSPNLTPYQDQRLPLSTRSLAGYVAISGEPLDIADAYAIPDNVPYRFDASFDRRMGYRTVSLLVIPLKNHLGVLLGVLQLINRRAPGTQAVEPFNETMHTHLDTLIREASHYLTISKEVQERIRSLAFLSVLRDPKETGPHTERVGALAAELYHLYALQNETESPEKIRHYKGLIRLAAKLHDIGKIGIPDGILKAPRNLEPHEYAEMKQHTVYGGDVFKDDHNEISRMANVIALHHHQWWDGNGYPAIDGSTLAGTDIPLCARITAIADAYDAIVSKRCYKDERPSEEAYAKLMEKKGTQFDPELLDIFLSMKETVAVIYKRFAES